MYCVKCGVRLADAEEKCPLCDTDCSVHSLPRQAQEPMYPAEKYPEVLKGAGARNGAILFLFCLPMLVCLFVDLQGNGSVNWSYYPAGAAMVLYVSAALPAWFRKPNPVIFVPCSFAALAAYLLLIERVNGGNWFLIFALPVVAALALIVTAVVVLTRYLKKGWLYIFGGAGIALGGYMIQLELLMMNAFNWKFTGWSVYPLIALAGLGGLLIFLGINQSAREKMERKFFL